VLAYIVRIKKSCYIVDREGLDSTIVVDDGTDEAIALEHGEGLEGLALAHDVGAFHVLFAGEYVVELTPSPIVRDLPIPIIRINLMTCNKSAKVWEVLVDGEHDGEHVGEVRSRLEEYTALMEGFADELVLVVVKL